jgi:hypothetical protein
MTFRAWLLPGAATLFLFAFTNAPLAQKEEHPEKHPKKEASTSEPAKEHPEHPEHPEGEVELTKDTLADAIEEYVAWDAALHGGHLFLHDPEAGETLSLTLEKVHRERLASLGDGVHFACADFKAANGHVYDIDMFMAASPGGRFHGLIPTEIAVHKKDGRARYDWISENGIWKKTKAR